MHNAMLTWQQARDVTAVLAGVGLVLTLVGRVLPEPATRGPRTLLHAARALAPFAIEAAIIAGLYSLWQLAGSLSTNSEDGAFARAHWIWNAERFLHLPSEVSVQHVVTAEPWVAKAANLYYASMHFTVMGIFLVWLFTWHRSHYRPVRRVLALTTVACLLVQFVPVAPPRFLPGLGFTDTANQYGQSVYGDHLGVVADQLSAMPSVHVAWAAIVGWTTLRIARGPWRWLGPAHFVVTVVVVVATANHFWADGIVAIALFAFCAGLESGGEHAVAAVRRARSGAAPRAELSPAPEQAILR